MKTSEPDSCDAQPAITGNVPVISETGSSNCQISTPAAYTLPGFVGKEEPFWSGGMSDGISFWLCWDAVKCLGSQFAVPAIAVLAVVRD